MKNNLLDVVSYALMNLDLWRFALIMELAGQKFLNLSVCRQLIFGHMESDIYLQVMTLKLMYYLVLFVAVKGQRSF